MYRVVFNEVSFNQNQSYQPITKETVRQWTNQNLKYNESTVVSAGKTYMYMYVSKCISTQWLKYFSSSKKTFPGLDLSLYEQNLLTQFFSKSLDDTCLILLHPRSRIFSFGNCTLEKVDKKRAIKYCSYSIFTRFGKKWNLNLPFLQATLKFRLRLASLNFLFFTQFATCLAPCATGKQEWNVSCLAVKSICLGWPVNSFFKTWFNYSFEKISRETQENIIVVTEIGSWDKAIWEISLA